MRKCSIVIFEEKAYFQYQGHMAHGHLNRREKILLYAATFLGCVRLMYSMFLHVKPNPTQKNLLLNNMTSYGKYCAYS